MNEVRITTTIGHLNDPRITKRADGRYEAQGVDGSFTVWIQAMDALTELNRRERPLSALQASVAMTVDDAAEPLFPKPI